MLESDAIGKKTAAAHALQSLASVGEFVVQWERVTRARKTDAIVRRYCCRASKE